MRPTGLFLDLQQWLDEMEDKKKPTDAWGEMVVAVPRERAADLGTPRNPNQAKWDSARISRATSSNMEDTMLPTQ